MTDEEVLSAAGRQTDLGQAGKREGKVYVRTARGGYHCKIRRKLGIHLFLYRRVLVLWMIVNAVLALKAFDPYPFILLNLVLSCVAAIQAPLIMMSQNRQEEKDRRRAENDYKVNLKDRDNDRGPVRQGQRHSRQAVGAGKAASGGEKNRIIKSPYPAVRPYTVG